MGSRRVPFVHAHWVEFFTTLGWAFTYQKGDEVEQSHIVFYMPCDHSECDKYHAVYLPLAPLIERKDGLSVASFYPTPKDVTWFMVCGHGGGVFRLSDVIQEWEDRWNLCLLYTSDAADDTR